VIIELRLRQNIHHDDLRCRGVQIREFPLKWLVPVVTNGFERCRLGLPDDADFIA
jgi:hypothetical protein